jgi:hypothetical protein
MMCPAIDNPTSCEIHAVICFLHARNMSAWGRAIAQAVSCWLLTAAVQGSRLGRHVGFCGGQSGTGAGFLRVLWFPLPNSFHKLLQKIIFIIINQSINHWGYVQ